MFQEWEGGEREEGQADLLVDGGAGQRGQDLHRQVHRGGVPGVRGSDRGLL